MANHLEALGNVLQLLAHVFAELLQRSAAIRAAVVFGSVRDGLARQMRRQGLALGPRLWRRFGANRVCSRIRRGLRGLQFFQFQFELFQLDDDLLALLTEDRAPQLLDQQLQMFDLLAASAQFIALFGELLGVARQTQLPERPALPLAELRSRAVAAVRSPTVWPAPSAHRYPVDRDREERSSPCLEYAHDALWKEARKAA